MAKKKQPDEPMCVCDHNPGGPCHCPPNNYKCDQSHHLISEVQLINKPKPEGYVEPAMTGHSGHDMHAGHGGHAGHAGHDHSHHDPKQFRNQFFVALALTIPTLLYSHMVQMLLGFSMPAVNFGFGELGHYIPAVFGTILFFTGGWVFVKSAIHELKARQPGMMALITLALVVAFGYSLFITVSQALGLAVQGMDFWWELATLVTIMLLGHWIEMSSIASAQNALGELAKLLPDMVEIVEGDETREIPLAMLKVGDVFVVRPGAKIAADGVVVSGRTKINESLLTGESAEVAKSVGDSVIGGTINAATAKRGQGTLRVTVTRVGEGTVLAGIMKLIAEAQGSKSRAQVLADRAAGWLFYIALASAVVTAAGWLAVGSVSVDFVLERVVTVLVIACPHALGLAIPLVTAITTSKAAKSGLLIRNRLDFELIRKADVVLFDKTGTLTEGKPGVSSVELAEGGSIGTKNELLALAAAAERDSEHPIASAIFASAKKKNIELPEASDFESITAVGVSCRIDGAEVMIGGPALLNKFQITMNVRDLLKADALNADGLTVVYVIVDGLLCGMIAIGDTLRETTKSAIFALRMLRLRVAIVSGDAAGVVNAVAKDLEITETFAEVMPAQKSEIVRKLQSDGSLVVMVGDGVNDAPALTQANVGIAIGAGTDVAVESAGIVLVSSDPSAVPRAIALSKRSHAKSTQNLIWAAGYNALAIPLAAGALMPLGFVLSPALGAVLMSLSTIIVAANAQLLRRKK